MTPETPEQIALIAEIEAVEKLIKEALALQARTASEIVRLKDRRRRLNRRLLKTYPYDALLGEFKL